MAKIKAHPLKNQKVDVPQFKGDTLKDIFDRSLKTFDAPENVDMKEYFDIYVNGYKMDKDFWEYVRPKESADVVIVMTPRQGQFGTFLKVAAVITVAVLTQNAPLAVKIGAVMATTLAMNALIPGPKNSQRSSAYSNYEDSQMFSIGSQSNQVKKYGNVHKVYGTFKNYPSVVGAPYAMIETDPTNGQKVQFLYTIYDFGLGPMSISDLRIGETKISEYLGVSYRFVDPNKPDVDEGPWDANVNKEFSIYKDDVEQVPLSLSLNRSSEPVEIVRNASTNDNNVKQEVFLNFIAPQGLYTVNTSGGFEPRTVQLKIEFADVGTNDWHLYDDFDFCERPPDRTLSGRFVNYSDQNVGDFPLIEEREAVVWIIWNKRTELGIPDSFFDIAGFGGGFIPSGYATYKEYKYGVQKGQPFTVYFNADLPLDTEFSIDGRVVGVPTSKGAESSGYWPYTFDPIDYDIHMFTLYQKTDNPDAPVWWTPNPDQWFPATEVPFIERTGSDRFIEVVPSGNFLISRSTQKPYYAAVSFTPRTTNSIKIRVTRVTSYGGSSFQIVDDINWTGINMRFQRPIVNTDKRHLFMELKIKATDQLNGSVDTLNAITTSVLDVYDDISGTWSKQESRNPAWVFADLLSGEVNKRAIDKSRLDTDSLKAWADHCSEIPESSESYTPGFASPRFECNYVLDYSTTLKEMLDRVSNSAGASFNVVNGKYGVLIDKKETVPVQVFTPRNSFNFRSTRSYLDTPHALRVSYVDPGAGWEKRDAVIYDDGYNEATATTFEDLDAFGVIAHEQAWRYGRYMIAQARLRQETISIDVDFEHLVCTRGDYVLLTQDVMRVGGNPVRVIAVSGVEITIDDKFTTVPLTDYGYTYRSSTGSIVTSTMTITSDTTADVDGAIPAVGDLLVWGVVDQITIDCVVKEIAPSGDLNATLTLLEKADAIHDAESSEVLPLYDPQISSQLDPKLSAPEAVTDLTIDEDTYDCVNNQYQYVVKLIWSPPMKSIYELFEIYVSVDGGAHTLWDTTREDRFTYIVDTDQLDLEHKFKVLAVNSSGVKIPLSDALEVTTTPTSKSTPPSNVDGLFLNVTNETMQMDWHLVEDCDIDFYQIRYSASLTATWDSSIPLMNTAPNQSMVFTQSRTGSYFIKAVDWNGNESATPAIARTSIPSLVNLNIIDETNDFPTFPGAFDRVTTLGADALILEEQISSADPSEVAYYNEGYYLYEGLLDLGEIYTCRIQSLIEAEGYSPVDLMSNWASLSDVDPLASSGNGSLWDVETYVRGTESLNVMSEWVTLSSINPISEGNQDLWSDWRKVTIGDFTARIFQFRLRLISYLANVTPRVYDAVIRSDMPDRVIEFNNLIVPNTGYSVTYDPAFKGPGTTPNIQVTQDNASSGDYYVITNKTLTGFDVTFYDNNDVAVQRQADFLIKGFGKKHTEVL